MDDPQADRARRVRTAGGIGVAAVVAAGAVAGAVELARTIPAGSLRVNGVTHKVESPPDTPLLYVLRDEMELKGPKFGCGLGQCGACAVLVGGKEVRSCITAWTGVKDEVTTLEGLPARWAASRSAPADALHPVQQAWIDEQVPQCGYCQSGMMMVAVQLLERVPNPTEAQIRDAYTNTPPSPHLCRCGTYMSIMAAVRRAGRSMA
jgi:isoquinoline 1-oxidoreductase alpha subunit